MSLTRVFKTAALGLALLVPAIANAMTVDDVMTMVNNNVPSNLVVQTMQNSGSKFTRADLQALQARGAPPEVITAASQMMSTAPAQPVPAQPIPAQPVPAQPMPAQPVPAPVAPAPAPDMLGGSLPTGPISAEEPSSSGPAELEQLIELYRAKKFLTASKGLYDLLNQKKFPDQETKIQYYLAKSLYDMGMFHSAQHYFMEVVRRGPSNPYFKYALPRLVAIAEHTGNEYELLRIVHKIPPEAFPRQAKNHLYYLMGRKLFDDDELTGSAQYFTQISEKSELYMRAKYYEGVIHLQRGKLKSAVMAFREVMKAQPPVVGDSTRDEEIEDLKDLALINVARIYFGLERFENADNYYAMVDRDSTYWPESLFERAWTSFWNADLNLALGLLLTVESPYFSDTEFIPEVTVLRALTFFNLCEYDEVEKILIGFEADANTTAAEMTQFLEQYRTNKDLRDKAYDAYFNNPHPQSQLSQSVFNRLLRNRDLGSMVSHLDMMDEEVEAIGAQKAAWQDTIGVGLKTQIEKDRQRYKQRAGTYLLKAMSEQLKIVNDLLVQSEIIRFEVVDAQRMDYEFKMKNADVEVEQQTPIDFATSTKIIYWPFNGEFWRDELGYYQYTEHGSCQ